MNDLELIDAVKACDYTTAQMPIKKGADVNQSNEQGWTPLNFAAGKGALSLVTLLVDNGADIFKVGRDQRTPYMIALARKPGSHVPGIPPRFLDSFDVCFIEMFLQLERI